MLGASIAVVFVYLWALLNAESQLAVGALVLILPAVLWMLRRTGRAQAQSAPRVLGVGSVLGVLALVAALHDTHFALLLLSTVLLYAVVGLGLNIQFGYAGVVKNGVGILLAFLIVALIFIAAGRWQNRALQAPTH